MFKTADYLVSLFTDPDVQYRVGMVHVKAEQSRGGDYTTLSSCSCPDFQFNEHKCKHLFLASRILGLPVTPPPRLAAPQAVLTTPSLVAPPPTGAVELAAVRLTKGALCIAVKKDLDARVQRSASRMPDTKANTRA
jgi:hypothetical protein